MAFDGVFMRALTNELDHTLKNARISKIQQPEKEELQITFRTLEKKKKKLFISANPSLPLIYFSEDSKAAPLSAPAFCMLLRKYLSSARVLSVTQPGLERVMDMALEHLNEMGDLTTVHLMIEIMGKYSNVILTDEDRQILDAIRRVPPTVSSVRTVLPGRPYFIPEARGKQDPLQVDREEFLRSLDPADTCLSALCDHYTGLYRSTISEYYLSENIDPDRYISQLSPEEKESFYDFFMSFIKTVTDGNFSCQAAYRGNLPEAFSALPLVSYMSMSDQYTIRTFDSPSGLLYTFYRDRNRETNLRQHSSDLRKSVQTHLERAARKLDLQEKQLKDAEKRDTFRHYGELLTAFSYSLPVGQDKVTVYDYTDNDKELTIPTDPDLSISDNAKKYYEKYNKQKRTFEALSVQHEETEKELAHLSSVIQAIDMAEDYEVIKQIREELQDAGYLKADKSRSKKAEKIRSKPWHYISSDGFDIYVGKNNLQNDQLTFKTADDDDIWMHAKGVPGSHVIIRTGGEEIPDRTYEEGAALALYYSQNRKSGKGEVDYIAVKHVKKPNGARPGFVVYYTNYSMMADADITGIRREDT